MSVSSSDDDIKKAPSPEIAVDIAAKDDGALKYADAGVELTPELERRLVRKADLYVCSMMCFVYAIQYMDKLSNGNAAIMGLRTDLNMTGEMYSWVGSSFYLGYLIFEIPVNLLLQRLPLAKTTSAFIILWGLVLAASAGSHSYAAFVTTRTLLGILEGAITPSFLVITSQWYRRDEQYSRVGVWFAWTGVGSIFGSAIAYGLYIHQDSYPISAWRLLFVILGVITIALGIVFYFLVPNSPSEAWYLNETERAAQVERIRDNKQGYGTHKIKWSQVKESFLDPLTYLHFAIVLLLQVPNGGLTNFSTILYEGMGFDTKRTLLIGMGEGGVALVGITLVGLASLWVLRGYRMVYACTASCLALLATSLLAWCPTNGGKIAGIMLWDWVAPCSYIALLSNISSNSAGSTKKSITAGTLLIGYCVGNLIGPQTFKATEDPTYQTAKTTMAACTAVNILLFFSLTFLNIWENLRRDRKNEKLPSSYIHAEFADLTDRQNPEFRYAL